MSSAAESFVIMLARASKRSRRLLRGFSKADRDDILANAILWCWEHRATYNPSVKLDQWFVGAVRNAMQDWSRAETMHASELLVDIPGPDDTAANAEALEAAEKLTAALPPEYKRVAQWIAWGYTWADMIKMGMAERTLREATKRVAQLKRLIPSNHELRQVLRHAVKQSDDSEESDVAPIDKEIAQLEYMPQGGRDCPPCWRCKWFDGFLPAGRRSVRIQIAEPEIRAAVLNIEARKIEIAKQVRYWRR